ncbi:MAG: hypothetical protein AAGE52_11650 [Myxococcota bacterium]
MTPLVESLRAGRFADAQRCFDALCETCGVRAIADHEPGLVDGVFRPRHGELPAPERLIALGRSWEQFDRAFVRDRRAHEPAVAALRRLLEESGLPSLLDDHLFVVRSLHAVVSAGEIVRADLGSIALQPHVPEATLFRRHLKLR